MKTFYCDFPRFQWAYDYAAKRSQLGHNVERVSLTEFGRRVHRVYFCASFLDLLNAHNVKAPA